MEINAKEMREVSYKASEAVLDSTRMLIEKLIKDAAKDGYSSICTMALPLKLINELEEAGFVVEVSKLTGTNKEITKVSW